MSNENSNANSQAANPIPAQDVPKFIDGFIRTYSVFIDSSLKNSMVVEGRPANANGIQTIDMTTMRYTFDSFLRCLDSLQKHPLELSKINSFLFIRELISNIFAEVEKPSSDYRILPYSQQVLGAVNPKFDGMASIYREMLNTEIKSDMISKSKLKLDTSSVENNFIKINKDLDAYFQVFTKSYLKGLNEIFAKIKDEPETAKTEAAAHMDKYLRELKELFPQKVSYIRALILVNAYYMIYTKQNIALAQKQKAEMEKKQAELEAEYSK